MSCPTYAENWSFFTTKNGSYLSLRSIVIFTIPLDLSVSSYLISLTFISYWRLLSFSTLMLQAPSGINSNPPVFLVLFRSLWPTHYIRWYSIRLIVVLSCSRKNGTVLFYISCGLRIGSLWQGNVLFEVGDMSPNIPDLLWEGSPSLMPSIVLLH